MSDIPEGFYDRSALLPEGCYLGPRGEVLLDFRREPSPSVLVNGHRRRGKVGGGARKKKRKVLLKQRDGDRCHYCEVKMNFPLTDAERNPRTATIEHIVPRSHGGSNQLSNLVLACYQCNHEREDNTDKCDCQFCLTAYNIFRSNHASV